ncbi:ribonucleoside-triphosphate reductase [Candidatus Saccharibacteria bacterium]|nr:ribonucleoside-triphosphate reductase [Candidatus Saccharibacteria bacterium]MBP7834560.1 ribonucleoside-triphosphate reductase [Candidatus Saccharibacteria bacterium]
MLDKISTFANENQLELKEKNNEIKLHKVVAERKAFLSKKKLEYLANIKIDDDNKRVDFTEMLKESGSGLSSGGGFDDGISPGFGFKAGTYKTGPGGISGNIEEQSKLFGKDYNYNFDYANIRNSIKDLAEKSGYTFKYSIF